jgi:hypothetical protein
MRAEPWLDATRHGIYHAISFGCDYCATIHRERDVACWCTKRTSGVVRSSVAIGVNRTWRGRSSLIENDPTATLVDRLRCDAARATCSTSRQEGCINASTPSSSRATLADDLERRPEGRIGVLRIGAVVEVGQHGTAQRLGAATVPCDIYSCLPRTHDWTDWRQGRLEKWKRSD